MLTLSSKEDTSAIHDTLNTKIDEVQVTLDKNTKATEDLLNTISDQQILITNLDKKVSQLEEDLDYRDTRISKLEKKIDIMELEKRKFNLIVHGVTEGGEDARSIIGSLLSDLRSGLTLKDCGSIYRIGQLSDHKQKSRPILVQLDKLQHKSSIFKNVIHLQGLTKWKHVSVSDDLTPEAAHKKADLRAVLNLAKLKGINASWKGQAIVVNEKRYTHSNLNELPNELSIENAKTLKIDHGIVFQGEHSFLSNFHRAALDLPSGSFQNVEQAYVHACALHCNTPPIAAEILKTPDPYTCKRLGKQIKTTAEWDRTKISVLENLVRAKFTQNPSLAEKLVLTGNVKLFECTRDRFFGVGVPFSQHRRIGLTNPGRNKLEEILQEIRQELQQ